jgi:alpha-amylase/alpha-mannosidase (GH57 family)
MDKYICIHGHFYQPPRENPWLEDIELQESAYPYHDWNARITAESYAPNAYARILRPDGKIADIVNNFATISFNIGPTLFDWFEHNRPDVYRRLQDADRKSRERFSGHSSAIAQAHNHMIMPLANSRDKRTQVLWGIADYEYRFGHRPEGMWLPETAVDLETLDIMAEQGIHFTILSPYQAHRTRKMGDQDWNDVTGGKVNNQIAYRCNLPSGRTIALFFYDGKISQEVAFEGLLSDGQKFADRLTGAFSKEGEGPRLVHIATDGETYGHHNHFADMALAWCVDVIGQRDDIHLTIYAEYLDRNPLEYEAEIFENSSWSCAHGVERWRSDCGDSTGMHQGWNQKWRKPLREALNWLRDMLVPVYELESSTFFKDPWAARDGYIRVILNRSPEVVDGYFAEHASHELARDEKIRMLRLLEMQRHAMLMFTSCGWFFDEISGIETVQVMLYAKRALQIVREFTGQNFEPMFMKMLENAHSNLPQFVNGAQIYDRFVKPTEIDLHRVAAHMSISSFFTEYPEVARVYSYSIFRHAYACYEMGLERMVCARLQIRSEVTWEEAEVDLAVLHLGAHNFYGGIRDHMSMPAYALTRRNLRESFLQGDIPETITRISLQFEHKNYSLWHLFRDEQRKVFNYVLQKTMDEVELSFRQISDHNYPVMHAMRRMGIKLPPALSTPVEYILNTDMRVALEDSPLDLRKIRDIVSNYDRLSVQPDIPTITFAAEQKIRDVLSDLSRHPDDIERVKRLNILFQIIQPMHLDLNIWEAQNCYLEIGKKFYKDYFQKAEMNDPVAEEWVTAFDELKEYLSIGEAEYALHELVV